MRFHAYGFIIALGVLAGYELFQRRAKFPDLAKDKINFILLTTGLSALVGGRLYHVIDLHQYYFGHPLEVFFLWQGGLAIYGSLVSGFCGLLLSLKLISRLDLVLKMTDLLAPSVLLAQSIGRWGNFFSQEAFGPPTNLPWAVFIPLSLRPPVYANFSLFQPLFLYESLWDLLGVYLILRFRRTLKTTGWVTGAYFLWYSFGRFFYEFGRIDTATVGGIKIAQVLSVIMFVAGVFLLFPRNYRKCPESSS